MVLKSPFHFPLFNDYLKKDINPFAREDDFGLKLQQVVNKTLGSRYPT